MEKIKYTNPPFFGQLQMSDINPSNNKSKNTNIHGTLLGLLCCATLVLIVIAMFHRQWICLLWILFMCLPLAAIMFLTRAQEATYLDRINEEHREDIADCLEMQTRRGVFGGLLTKSAKPVWLAEEGVFVYKRTFFSWSKFTNFVLEPSTLARELKPIYRLRLILKEPRTVSRRTAYFSIILLLAPVVIGGASLIYYFSHIGVRYDVFALFFANLTAIYLFTSMTYRYVRSRAKETADITVLFDQQRIQSEQLVSFLREMLAVE